MAYNKKIADRIREALSHIKDIEEKKMFRGVTFMVKGKMCISVGDDEMMCRIDPALQEELIKKKGCSIMKMRGREYKGYVLVSEEGMKSKKDFDYWIALALDFNERAKSSKRK